MNDDYLWDRSGPSDPEVQHLERTLAPLRYRHRADFIRPPVPRTHMARLAAAAAVLVLLGASQLLVHPTAPLTNWQVAALAGDARLGTQKAEVAMKLRAGQLVRTAPESQIAFQSDEMGRIEIGPQSEFRANSNKLVALDHGLLHAYIWAMPGQFMMDTPSARAIDLGCEYTIEVDRAGNGRLRVKMGWVAFRVEGRESFIPAGAACVTRKETGLGIPYFEDASPEFLAGLRAWESGHEAALPGVLAAARPRDGITLWHLLTQAPDAWRPTVYDRFAQLVELPPEVTREGVLRKDPRMIDLLWDSLNLENTSWWRGWEREWK